MAKPITLEMLEAMSLDQRKTLHRNASGLNTPAAHAVLEMLAQGDLMGRPKSIVVPRAKTAKTTTSAAKPKKVKAEAPSKAIKAVHGRQA